MKPQRISLRRFSSPTRMIVSTLSETVLCGLAHGKRAFLLNDFGVDLVAVAEDLPVIKLLARMVVEKT
jgi:hypothetical protein